MKLFLIALKGLRRKKIRSLLTIGGVAIAVAVLVSLLGFDAGYQKALVNDIDRMGYQVLITAKGCPYEAATLMLKGGGGLRYMEEDIYAKITRDERIDKLTPQLVATVFDRDKAEGQGGISLYMGIDNTYLELKPWLKFKSGGWFTGQEVEEAIMGYEAAEVEQRIVGDEIFIAGKDRILKVAGILERTGTQDDGIIFVPLKTVQAAFDLPGKISGIGIKLKNIADLPAFEEDLYDEPAIQVISMAQVKGTIFNLMSSAKVLTSAVALVAIIIAVTGVMNTILMSVFERTKEIGVMKALGASRVDIFKLIWFETTIICFIGSVSGELLAVLGSSVVEIIMRRVLPYVPGGRLVDISPGLLAAGLVGALATGIVASVYPASRAAGMKPVEAIRSSE